MDRTNRYLAITIFIVAISSFSIVSGYQYVGDYIEKFLNGIGMFLNYFVLIALFSIYKGTPLFTRKQLLFLAFSSVVMTFVSYFYPYFKYSEQDSRDLMSTFFYDLIINIFVFTVLFKESKNGCSKNH